MAHDRQFAVMQPRYTNARGLTTLFAVSNDTITSWRKMGLPVESRGVYDVRACVQWYKMETRVGPKVKDADEEKSASLRLTIAKAEKQERENLIADENLISREMFSGYVQYLGTLFTNTIEALGARLANQLASMDDPAEVQMLVWQEGRESRRTMVQKLKEQDLKELFPDED